MPEYKFEKKIVGLVIINNHVSFKLGSPAVKTTNKFKKSNHLKMIFVLASVTMLFQVSK